MTDQGPAGWEETMSITTAPRDGSIHVFEISFVAQAFWDDDLRRWVLVREIDMDYVPADAKYLGPLRNAIATGDEK
jgi:hypothetical protein